MKHINTKDLKENVDVAGLLTEYGLDQIADSDDWVTAVCPFHSDTKPSFSMRKSDTYYHCWSCEARGDAIKFIMEMDNINFSDALTKLAGMSGYEINSDSQLEYLRSKWLNELPPEDKKPESVISDSRMYHLNSLALEFFKKSYAGSLAQEYVRDSRFIADNVAIELDFGFYPGDGTFIEHMKKAGATDTELAKAGFIVGGVYERFQNRLMFPVYGWKGDVIVAFSGRALYASQEPKYTTSPNSEFYKKGFFLFGYEKVTKHDTVFLVEGNLDRARLFQEGINSLALLGSSLTSMQGSSLRAITDKIVMMFDGDEGGQKAFCLSLPVLIRNDIKSCVVDLPSNYDPDTFVLQNGKEAIKRYLKDPVAHFVRLRKERGDSEMNACMKIMNAAKHSTLETKTYYGRRIGEILGLSTETVISEIKRS